MPIDIKILEEDIDEIKIEDDSSLEVQGMGNKYIKYANTNHPESLEDTYDDPITDGVVHPYIGIAVGIQEPLTVNAYSWSINQVKTINGESIVGIGNIEVGGGSGSEYSAGTGIIIEDHVISVDNFILSSLIGYEEVNE